MYTRESTNAATFPMQKLTSTAPTPTDTADADIAKSTSSWTTTFTGWTDAHNQTKPLLRMNPANTALMAIGNIPAPHTTARPVELVSANVTRPSAKPAATDGMFAAFVIDARPSR